MALQLYIEAVAKQLEQQVDATGGQMALTGGKRTIEWPARSTCKRNDAGGLAGQPFGFKARRFVRRRFQESARIQAHQAAVALGPRGKQHNARALGLGIGIARTVIGIAEVDGKRTADDGLDAISRYFFRKLQRTKHVVGVGQRERRLPIRFRKLGQPRDRERAFEQGIGRVHMQVHEIEAGHG